MTRERPVANRTFGLPWRSLAGGPRSPRATGRVAGGSHLHFGLESLEDRTLLSGLISITPVDPVKSEGNAGGTPFTFAIIRTGDLSGTAAIDYTTAGAGLAAANAEDFGGYFPSGTVLFMAGESRKTVAVNVAGDTAVEGNEGFAVRLGNPVGGSMGKAAALATIRNDDSRLSVSAKRAVGFEGNQGISAFTFVVNRTGLATGAASVSYAVAGSGSNPAAGADFGAGFPVGTVRLAPGQTAGLITIAVKGDSAIEPDEGFRVVLSNPVGALLATSSIQGTIANDDAAFTVAALDADKREGNTGTTSFTFRVDRVGYVNAAASVRFATGAIGANPASIADLGAGSATAWPGGVLGFPAGVASRTVAVAIHGDVGIENDEDFAFRLSAPSGSILIRESTAVGHIRDDDGMRMNAAAPQILLNPDTLGRLRRMAAEGTPQWRAFRDRLDGNLDVVIADDIGSYQGEQLASVADYALGYQVLRTTDPRGASKYADKAIGLMKSGLHDYQKGSWVARKFLARGDGGTRTFTLPNASIHPGTLSVYISPVTTSRVVHGRMNGQDEVGYYQDFLKVSRTRDGSPDFRTGIDWSHNPDHANNMMDWSLPGAEPAAGTAYYVTSASGAEAERTAAYSVSGNRVTFRQAPRSSQAVYVQYIYGAHSADGSTLDYQQTSAGDGGFNSIFIDDTYTSRYLGTCLAMGLDWLDGYAGFGLGLRREAAAMLTRWADWLATPNPEAFGGRNGYFYDSPLSNYGAGSYGALVMTALALGPRAPAGPRLLDAALAYREQRLLPALQDPTDSAKGGYWSEGWNYGHNAVQQLLIGARALEAAGKITATAERTWAGEVVESLNSAQSAPGLLYDGGDVYQYPFRLLDKSLFYSLSDMASGAAARANANYYLRAYPDSAYLNPHDTNDFRDLLFHDPGAPAAYWPDQPLAHFASGTGLLTARSDWGDTPTWLSLQMGNLLPADHQNYSPGQLQISRGPDRLLINAFQVEHVFGDDSASLRSLSQFGNVVAVNDLGATDAQGYPLQETPFCMGVDYGSPGVTVGGFESTADHVYLNGDYHAAYSYPADPGAGGPASALTRQLVYLRGDIILVHDHVVTTSPEYDKQVRWNFDAAPVLSGNSFQVASGGSKLFGRILSSSPLDTSMERIVVAGDPTAGTYRVTSRNTNTSPDVSFITAFQASDSARQSMDATVAVASDDGRMEGVLVGDRLVMFGRNGNPDPATPLSYEVNPGNSPIGHLLVNLQPGRAFQIVGDGLSLGTAVASANGVLSFTTPAGARRIQLSPMP